MNLSPWILHHLRYQLRQRGVRLVRRNHQDDAIFHSCYFQTHNIARCDSASRRFNAAPRQTNTRAPHDRLAQVKTALSLCAVLAAVLLTYSNHFENTFHFDDDHTIVQNPYIRDLHNLPLFFTDARTFSTLPPNRAYRPLVTASLAIDYALGHGLRPVFFHASTFLWFLVQLALMYALFLKIGRNHWIALFAAGLYG